MNYLKLLKSVIVHHEYINKGRYKYDDVAELVNSVGYQDYDPSAAAFACSIFEECFGSSWNVFLVLKEEEKKTKTKNFAFF